MGLHEQHGLGLPLVSMNFDFTGQVHAGDDIKIEPNATVGESSVQFKDRASHNGEVVFEGTEHRVCVPMDGDSGITVPDDLREALESV